jgi:hypothetical protein
VVVVIGRAPEAPSVHRGEHVMFAFFKQIWRSVAATFWRLWPGHSRGDGGHAAHFRHASHRSDLWSIFRGDDSIGFAPHRPVVGVAPPRPRTIPLQSVTPPTSDLEGAVRKVRRAAVADLFDVLGLDYMPSSLWHCVDRSEDIGDGMRTYFTALGLRTDKIRAKRKAEIARANDVLGLIVEIQGSFELLPLSVADRLADELFSGDFEVVRRAAKAAACASRIRATGHSWRETVRLPVSTSLADRVRQVLTDPFSLEEEALVELEMEWRMLVRLLLAYDHAQVAAENVRTGPASTEAIGLLTRFDSLERKLRAEDFLLSGSDQLVRELEGLGRRLSRFVPNGSAISLGENDGAVRAASSELEAAVLLLHLKPNQPLNRRAILNAYRAYLRANHPDLGSQGYGDFEHRSRGAHTAMRARDFLLARL